MALHMDDTGEFGNEAPRPVDAASVERGAFAHLEEGEGAVAASSRRGAGKASAREEEAPQVNKRMLAIIVAGALAVIAVVVVLFVRVLDAPAPVAEESTEAEQVAVARDETITLRGNTYELEQVEGTYVLVEVREGDGGQRVTLGEIAGEPAGLMLYDGAVIVPENLADGTWDVLSFTIGSGWSQIADQEGNALGGSGTIEEASLEGSSVLLTVDGAQTEIPLVW